MNKPPLVVCFPFIGDEVGGSHISALKLVAGLDRSTVRPLVVLHQPHGPLAAYLVREGIDFIAAPDIAILAPKARQGQRQTRLWSYMTGSAPELRKFIRSHGVDIVHTNDGQMHATWGLAARLAGAKFVWHHRGDPDSRGANILAPILAHSIVTVSRFAQPRRPIMPVARKLSVVFSPFDHPHSIPDRARAHAALAKELGLDARARFLGYVGGLIDRKRPVAFVDAVHAVIESLPHVPVHGLLLGEPQSGGPRLDLAVTERAQELGIAERIHLMGFRQPIEPLMCGIDILLVPAVSEPFGRTLIEAMMLGTPVVATDHGGNPEAIAHGENGFLVQPENASAFVEPVRRLLTDPEIWYRISEVARSRALASYGVAMHVKRISEIYAALMRKHGMPA